MNTSTKAAKQASERAFVPYTALAKSVEFDDATMKVALMDGRTLWVPLAWFPRLRRATPEQRAACEIGGGGLFLHWEEIDEDLTVAGLLAGGDRHFA